jgi:hypothetical protein
VGSQKANMLMLAFGIPVAVLGGWLLPFAHRAIVTAFNATEDFSCFGLFAVWVAPMITSGFLGYFIARVIGQGALAGKGRNIETAQIIGLISGLVGGVAFAIGRSAADGAEAYDSTIDVIRVIVNSLIMVVVARLSAGKAISDKPFCETCELYMKSLVIQKIPIRDEVTWVHL